MNIWNIHSVQMYSTLMHIKKINRSRSGREQDAAKIMVRGSYLYPAGKARREMTDDEENTADAERAI